jgi:hypothetical protein
MARLGREALEAAKNPLLVYIRNSDAMVADFELHPRVLLRSQRHFNRAAGTELDGIRDQVGDDLLQREPVPSAAQCWRNLDAQRRAIESGLGGVRLDYFPHDFGEVNRLDMRTHLGIHSSDIEEQGGALHVAIHDLLDAFETADERLDFLLTGDLHGRGDLQQQGMHGIAQLVGRYGEELVAGLKLLLQLRNPGAQARFVFRETAL